MPIWSPKIGETLLIPSGPKAGQKHLHVVLNDPKPLLGFGQYSCVLACLCSVPTSGIPYDTTREFAAASHPFIVKQTYVSYGHLQVMSAPHLVQCVVDGTFVVQAPFLTEYVTSIIDGYPHSGRVPRYLKGLQI